MANKLKKRKLNFETEPKVFLGLLALVVLILFGGFLLSTASRQFKAASPDSTQKLKVSNETAAGSPQEVLNFKNDSQTVFFLHPPSLQANQGETVNLEIKVKTESLPLSTLAVRFYYQFEKEPPLKPVGEKMDPNSAWLNSGWAFPVNRVFVDREKKMVVGEIAAANLDPAGYSLSGEETIASVKLLAQQPNQKSVFTIDPDQTLLITKTKQAIKPQLRGGVYQIK